jgi:hypothetical protein
MLSLNNTMAHLFILGGGFIKCLCSSFPFGTMIVVSKLGTTLIYVLMYGFFINRCSVHWKKGMCSFEMMCSLWLATFSLLCWHLYRWSWACVCNYIVVCMHVFKNKRIDVIFIFLFFNCRLVTGIDCCPLSMLTGNNLCPLLSDGEI